MSTIVIVVVSVIVALIVAGALFGLGLARQK